jgi:hypothetical protein
MLGHILRKDYLSMKHIDFEKGIFVRNMLIVDPRTGKGDYALVKCSIEDAIACEMITQKEVDAARQAKFDQGKDRSMNEAQRTHIKSMAYKIRRHAEAIVTEMQGLEETSLPDIPDIPDSETIEAVDGVFRGALYYCEAIRKVYDDMLPKLPRKDFQHE